MKFTKQKRLLSGILDFSKFPSPDVEDINLTLWIYSGSYHPGISRSFQKFFQRAPSFFPQFLAYPLDLFVFLTLSPGISSTDFFFQAEDGIRDQPRSRGLGDVYKRQAVADKRLIKFDAAKTFTMNKYNMLENKNKL